MSNNPNKPSKTFWIIAIIGLIWNAMGVDGYLNQAYQTERFELMYSEAQLNFIYSTPSWVMATFAIAVFSSVIACILLLFKKRISKVFFLIGLIAVVLQTVYNLFFNPGKELYGYLEYTMLLIIPLFSVFLFWYSKKCADDGILT